MRGTTIAIVTSALLALGMAPAGAGSMEDEVVDAYQ
jgi:hypothetical protein